MDFIVLVLDFNFHFLYFLMYLDPQLKSANKKPWQLMHNIFLNFHNFFLRYRV